MDELNAIVDQLSNGSPHERLLAKSVLFCLTSYHLGGNNIQELVDKMQPVVDAQMLKMRRNKAAPNN